MDSKNIQVDLAKQALYLLEDNEVVRCYSISSAKNGPGEEKGSECTPRGRHRIRIKIGAGQPENAVFVGRRATGEIYSPELGGTFPDRDWILSRILWLTGLESGRNRGGQFDSLRLIETATIDQVIDGFRLALRDGRIIQLSADPVIEKKVVLDNSIVHILESHTKAAWSPIVGDGIA